MNYGFLVSIAIIIVFTKVLGDITNKFNLTQVVGALFAGIIIGPAGFGLVEEDLFCISAAEIGVILLMFTAGLDTSIPQLKANLKACMAIAVCGVVVPLMGGAAAYYFYFTPGATDFTEIMKAVFVGVVLAATSVSITVEALREMGKLETKVGNAILGAAVIDDVLGIIVLTIVMSMKDTSVSLSTVFIKIALYCVFMGIIALLCGKFKNLIDGNLKRKRVTTFALAACFVISYLTEVKFGIADITGAYLLGLFLSGHEVKPEICKKIAPMSYLIFSPIFFASVGLKVDINGITGKLVIFAIILLVVASMTKVVGCGIGAKLCGFNAADSTRIGVGMIARGEVALIVAQKGFAVGLIESEMFAPIVIMIIFTTVCTPLILKKIM